MLAFHVAISVLALFVSAWCIYGMLMGRLNAVALHLFFGTHILTDLTGFPLAPYGFDPARAVGVISLVILAIAAFAYYAKHAAGRWRPAFVASFFAAAYLNFFVGLTQAFQKVGVLQALAPAGNELPFVLSQLVLLVAFIALGVIAAPHLRPRASTMTIPLP